MLSLSRKEKEWIKITTPEGKIIFVCYKRPKSGSQMKILIHAEQDVKIERLDDLYIGEIGPEKLRVKNGTR